MRRLMLLPATLSLLATLSAAAQVVVPDDFDTIADAIEAIEEDPSLASEVVVEPGTYRESITLPATLPDNLILRGRETARTFLEGDGDAPAITLAGALGARISNFTFTGGEVGILVTGADPAISNNVFQMDSGSTAISVEGLADPTIAHNVFYRTDTAIASGGNLLTIRNNVFVSNDATVDPVPSDEGGITNNAFFDVADADELGDVTVTGDPEFVDPDAGDFHLRSDSPLIDEGSGSDVLDSTTADIGAYGGPFADPTPFPVHDLSVLSVTADGLENSVELQWSANAWYRLGGYRLYYDSDSSGSPYEGVDADEGPSPIDVGDVTTFALHGLSASAGAPPAPELAPPQPLDGALDLSWSAASGAEGYIVHWGIASADENSLDVGNTTAYRLSGLENGTTYRIFVTAYDRNTYFFAVTAYGEFGANPESALSAEVTAAIGPTVESLPSNEVSDFPEAIVPFPNLPDENGCFIATAAYGYYGAREVQLLRQFRDRFLLPNPPGRAFVAWYYRHSPRWADWLRRHPHLRPLVRAALLPAILIAAWAVKTPPAFQLLLLLLLAGAPPLLRGVRRGGTPA